ncbi:hypothetical protein HBN50_00760 [Halobacteriovorax sp. GB3]|uniref:hypothetical protein n=1 Tax=Halobacteriovorax sp. GB3 TaxID=2719615 RepID=UPI00235EDC89|nr:hypothetical protein [Halobacteriovorax sp. GB3]MDD0851597.1 hypothetical protein [Halobacteriovorax sp. GB3]
MRRLLALTMCVLSFGSVAYDNACHESIAEATSQFSKAREAITRLERTANQLNIEDERNTNCKEQFDAQALSVLKLDYNTLQKAVEASKTAANTALHHYVNQYCNYGDDLGAKNVLKWTKSLVKKNKTLLDDVQSALGCLK